MRLCLCFLIGIFLASCSAGYYVKRGNIIYKTGRYHKALDKYAKAYDKAKSKGMQAETAVRAAEACERVNRLKEAQSWYRRIERTKTEQPELYLKMGEIHIALGEWETAAGYYRKHEDTYGDGRGKDGLYRLEQVKKDLQETGRYVVEPKRELNFRSSDFAPVYAPDDTCTVYFASTRKDKPSKRKGKKDPVTGEGYSHIFVSRYVQEVRSVDKLGNVKVKKFKDPRWLKPEMLRDSLWSTRHEGAMCFGKDGNTLYFTSSRMLKGSNRGTRIFRATKSMVQDKTGEEKEVWKQVALTGICGDSVSIGHPALTPDGFRLYFATDQLPGGMGGKDIWYVENQNGKWSEPVNAGELVNTPGDELFPYVRDNGELYFASNGHYGFGGLDIYKVKENEGKTELFHLPAPLNSYADDFGIVYKPGSEEGLLTSSRSGRTDDIYSFQFIPQQLQVRMLAQNAVTESPVAGIEVTVTADDGEITYLETDSAGYAILTVVPDREYAFVTQDPRFLKGKGTVSTYREKADRLYDLTVEMQPIEKPIVIPNIYFDVAKWDLRPDARENLKVLLTILKDNPHIAIELSAHTDMVGNDRANMVLSERRAQSVVDYLIEQGVYWDRLEAKGYGETQPRQINEKDAKAYPFLKAGEVLTERFVTRLRGQQREDALQLNRRIEFKVLRTNYKPGPQSLHNPNQKAIAAEEGVAKVGETQLRDLKQVPGKFFTLQLGVFKTIPALIYQFRTVFTEKLSGGAVRYCTGVYDTRPEADAAAKTLQKKGIECFVKAFEGKD